MLSDIGSDQPPSVSKAAHAARPSTAKLERSACTHEFTTHARDADVRFTCKRGHRRCISGCLLRATNGLVCRSPVSLARPAASAATMSSQTSIGGVNNSRVRS
jgi:hypothetical protein